MKPKVEIVPSGTRYDVMLDGRRIAVNLTRTAAARRKREILAANKKEDK